VFQGQHLVLLCKVSFHPINRGFQFVFKHCQSTCFVRSPRIYSKVNNELKAVKIIITAIENNDIYKQ
jgi:hypothetical protein